MDQANIFSRHRKVLLDDVVENTEQCLRCKSLGHHNTLRYFLFNPDTGIYKCASPKCWYPFRNYRFKDFKENISFLYEEIKVEPKQEPQCFTEIVYDNLASSNNLTDTDSMSMPMVVNHNQSQNMDTFDFDFSIDLLDDTVDNSVSELPSQMQTIEEQFDLNGLLDELIGNTNQVQTENSHVNLKEEEEGEEEREEILKVEEKTISPSKPITNTPRPSTDQRNDVTVKKEKTAPKLKLTKCLEHMEKKFKIKKEIPEKVIDSSEHNPATVILDEPKQNAKEKCTKVADILSKKNTMRPMSLLEQLQSLECSQLPMFKKPERMQKKTVKHWLGMRNNNCDSAKSTENSNDKSTEINSNVDKSPANEASAEGERSLETANQIISSQSEAEPEILKDFTANNEETNKSQEEEQPSLTEPIVNSKEKAKKGRPAKRKATTDTNTESIKAPKVSKVTKKNTRKNTGKRKSSQSVSEEEKINSPLKKSPRANSRRSKQCDLVDVNADKVDEASPPKAKRGKAKATRTKATNTTCKKKANQRTASKLTEESQTIPESNEIPPAEPPKRGRGRRAAPKTSKK